MPKVKTHKGTSKRIWVSGSGKMRRRHAMRSHHRGRQSENQAHRRQRDEGVAKQNPRLRELIPYK